MDEMREVKVNGEIVGVTERTTADGKGGLLYAPEGGVIAHIGNDGIIHATASWHRHELHGKHVDPMPITKESVMAANKERLSDADLDKVATIIGKKAAPEHPDNQEWFAAKLENERAHQWRMLGYNEAMLDWATFPISRGPDDAPMTRAEVESVVASLRDELSE